MTNSFTLMWTTSKYPHEKQELNRIIKNEEKCYGCLYFNKGGFYGFCSLYLKPCEMCLCEFKEEIYESGEH